MEESFLVSRRIRTVKGDSFAVDTTLKEDLEGSPVWAGLVMGQ